MKRANNLAIAALAAVGLAAVTLPAMVLTVLAWVENLLLDLLCSSTPPLLTRTSVIQWTHTGERNRSEGPDISITDSTDLRCGRPR